MSDKGFRRDRGPVMPVSRAGLKRLEGFLNGK
jgi:hypothetical protein